MYLIAEIGVNFYDIAKKYNISPLDACKLMVKEAKDCGCSCVKFQSYKADTLACKKSPAYWDTTKETTQSQYELFKKFDSFDENDFKLIYEYSRSIGIDFISTPFDINSANYLDKYQDMYKISSSDITNYQLLKCCASKKKPILLSTGASNINEIKESIKFLEKNGCPKVIPMHCVLNYPTPNEYANLNMIDDIKEHFPSYEIGYSDHTCPDENMLILTTAYNKGALYIEKHFTLDKTIPGNDHYHSGDPKDFKKIVDNVKLIDIVSGEKIKQCGEMEKKSRLNARRSVIAKCDIKEGDIFSEKNLICKRPGTGVCASKYYDIIGKKSNRNILSDEMLLTNDYEKN